MDSGSFRVPVENTWLTHIRRYEAILTKNLAELFTGCDTNSDSRPLKPDWMRRESNHQKWEAERVVWLRLTYSYRDLQEKGWSHQGTTCKEEGHGHHQELPTSLAPPTGWTHPGTKPEAGRQRDSIPGTTQATQGGRFHLEGDMEEGQQRQLDGG